MTKAENKPKNHRLSFKKEKGGCEPLANLIKGESHTYNTCTTLGIRKKLTTDYEENKTFCKNFCQKDTINIIKRKVTDLEMISAIYTIEKDKQPTKVNKYS